ncbi:hypothetical protein M378DRAFT_17003 [Amanita muscaria Koide BX008]|uniref:NACHT domain-containing protein n=1 Tax=Amanita muscaria (strain Koide BX008) TaxID=946122 RepID=A0A0C2SRE3_AMAMK|nr:hypothetical protein M378DRAFT_17003 [Amanita muscaria Koide BX008]
MVPQSLPPEQSALYNYGFQRYHVQPPVARPLPQLVAEPNHITAGYPQHYVPPPPAFPQPQLAYYSHPQLLQQQQHRRLHRTPPPQDLRPEKRQRFDGPNLNRQAQQHAPVATQLQGAQVNMSGNPRFTIIRVNKGKLTTVNNYGGSHVGKFCFVCRPTRLESAAEQDPDRRFHPGTPETVLKRLRDWFDNPNPRDRITWLHGPAGAGKSTIAQTIANEYKGRGVAATFFFYRSDFSRNDGNRLFPTIAWQLAFSIPAIKDFIIHGLDKTPNLPTKRVETQFEQLVAHPFHAMNHIATQMLHSAPVVIIDGVDECCDKQLQRRILAVIGNEVKDRRVPLRFLIVSRPEALIEETLNKFKEFTVSIDLYLEDKFSEITSSRGLDPTWPGQGIIQEIVSKSSRNFIFASLVIRFISDEDRDPEYRSELGAVWDHVAIRIFR